MCVNEILTHFTFLNFYLFVRVVIFHYTKFFIKGGKVLASRYRNKRRFNKRKKKSRFTEIEKFAYKMGKVARGVKNSDSRVYSSYQNGLKGQTTSKKKPLI